MGDERQSNQLIVSIDLFALCKMYREQTNQATKELKQTNVNKNIRCCVKSFQQQRLKGIWFGLKSYSLSAQNIYVFGCFQIEFYPSKCQKCL